MHNNGISLELFQQVSAAEIEEKGSEANFVKGGGISAALGGPTDAGEDDDDEEESAQRRCIGWVQVRGAYAISKLLT